MTAGAAGRWLAAGLAAVAWAALAADCDAPAVPAPPVGAAPIRQHHPVDRSLPGDPGFNQPTGCGDGFWFFDQNGNARADASEPRLFGRPRQLACVSCHAGDATPGGAAATVFLRQDPATLCLSCHNL